MENGWYIYLFIAFMLIIGVALFQLVMMFHRQLVLNRALYARILREQHLEILDAKRKAERTANIRLPAKQLYFKLTELMNKEKPYTDVELNRETLAEMLGSNHRYIDEAIRGCSEYQSTNAFINGYRVDHAARMLSETDEPITLIAEMSGFANRTSFNNLFRERFKMTPSEFRKTAKAKSGPLPDYLENLR